jgi:protein-L-isoaspartate(D-aspartate) O-methyltransferase
MKTRLFKFILLVLVLTCACQDTPTKTSDKSPAKTIPPATGAQITIPAPSPTTDPSPTTNDNFSGQREQMVSEQIAPRDINDPAILEAMRKVPRHEFVPEDLQDLAYADTPLPIGYGQTISQPYIVALMTQSLQPSPGQKVLEIGTGSGYQAAILAEIGVDVYTVEIIPELAAQAAERLERLGYGNIHMRNADGYFGWEEHAPFDAVMVTAAPDHLPQPLAEQLVEGGRLVIPIGPVGFLQTLWLFEKSGGEMNATNLGGVTFVPLTGEH